MRIYDNKAMKNRSLAREALLDNFDDDFNSPDNIAKRYQKIEDAFDMPKEEGWEPSDFGEKSFVKNKDKDNGMFIQYNGADYDGDNQEWVAGYMKDGGYVSKKFATMEDAKDFLNNSEIHADANKGLSEEQIKKADQIVDYFKVWGKPGKWELQDVVNFYRLTKPMANKVFKSLGIDEENTQNLKYKEE